MNASNIRYATRSCGLRGVQKQSNNIAIIAIDDFSFNWTGYQWPWPRSYLAEIVDQVNKGGGKVVGVDVFLFEPDKEPKNDQAFADALGKASLRGFGDSNIRKRRGCFLYSIHSLAAIIPLSKGTRCKRHNSLYP